MKKYLPIVVIGILVLSGLGASALSNNAKEVKSEKITIESTGDGNRGYTHTVLVEGCTASWCPPCAPAAVHIYNIYNSGNYDFEYVALVLDKNGYANARCGELNVYYIPDYVFDGGYTRHVGSGGLPGEYTTRLDQCGARSVADIDLDLEVTWNGDAEMDIDLDITNNEASSYSCHLHVYVTEIESRWNTNSGQPYHFAMVGNYAFNTNVNVPAGGTSPHSTTWDGDTYGVGDIEEDNIMVIATVFDSSTKFVDETTAAYPEETQNNPPEAPDIEGPASGNAGTSYDYTFTSIDPEGDDVKYYIRWGDGDTEWTSFEASGTPVTVSHTWSKTGTFTIQAKAKDSNNAQSGYSTLTVTMPFNQNHMTGNSVVLKFLQRLSQILPLSS